MGYGADDLMFKEIGLPDTEFFTGKRKPMTTKYTPAPWRYIRGNNCMYITSGELKNGTAFCEVMGIDWDQAQANANIIASAPIMLEALKTVAKELEDVAEVPQCVYDAIAQAEGRA